MKNKNLRDFWDEEGRKIGLTPMVLIVAKGGEVARMPYCQKKVGICKHLRGGVCEVFFSGCRPKDCPHYEEGR